jgi:superfamily II DNA or RNA helicase
MNYFKPHYVDLHWPIKQSAEPGLRPPQLGAMHAVAAHFTRHNTPAIVTMPTGSGKTVVISALPYLLRAERVLVLTPSRMVREQLVEEFTNLLDLRRFGVMPMSVPAPTVYNVTEKLSTLDHWANLRPYDVIVGTPNSVSPEFQDVARPPLNFFDVVLVDEAHHAAARSWKELLEYLSPAKQVMFTATPFRRDRRELVGKLVYVYELRAAFNDGVFGKLEYIPVDPEGNDPDIAIAKAASARLRADQKAGLAHLVMVRTGTKSRAADLVHLYEKYTDLKLQMVIGDHSLKRLRATVDALKKGEIDGIICVDMLGEGFDLPNLKIAALHTPHKSLAVTLQFIGRFARTTAKDLGRAAFFAIESDLEIERQRLYDQGAAWEDIIPNLSATRIQQEEETREILGTFEAAEETIEDAPDLSLYSLRPYHHLKILHSREPIDISQELQPPPGFSIIHRHLSIEENTAVYVLQSRTRPEWTSVDHLDTIVHELLVLFFHEESGFFFVCSSLRTQGFYEHIAAQFGNRGPLRGLSFKKINRVLLDLRDLRLFNVGMRNATATKRSESYRTVAGPSVDETIELADRRRFRRGHWFGSANDDGTSVTIGLSTASKVWSNTTSQIPQLVTWCKHLARKIASDRIPQTNSGLDHLPMGEEIELIPADVSYIDWNESAYFNPPLVTYRKNDDMMEECQLLDLELGVDRTRIHQEWLGLTITAEGGSHSINFRLDRNPIYFEDDGEARIFVEDSDGAVSIADYLNRNLPTFYTANCGSFEGCNYFDPSVLNIVPFSPDRIESVDWEAANVDIEVEIGQRNSVHAYLRDRLLATDAQIILYDHGPGELADFVTFNVRADDILVSLYHCKGSSMPQAGERVDDLYELCGQAIKSVRWVGRQLLSGAINRRSARHSPFLRGTLEQTQELLSGDLPFKLQIILVQPGLSKVNLTHRGGNLLASVDEYVRGGRCVRIKVWASA